MGWEATQIQCQVCGGWYSLPSNFFPKVILILYLDSSVYLDRKYVKAMEALRYHARNS